MSKKLILKNVRFSYVRVFEAVPIMDGNTNYYSVSILIPKTDTKQVNEIKRALKELADEFLVNNPKFKGNLPEDWWNPLQDGDKKGDAGYDGMFVLNAKRQEKNGKPIVIDKHKQPITVKEDMYSGSWGTASINLYTFFKTVSKCGVGVGLNGIQKVTDDDRLDGGASVNDFEDEGGSDNGLSDFE